MALAVEPQPHLHGAASERPNRPASKNVAAVIGRLDTREASEAARRRHLPRYHSTANIPIRSRPSLLPASADTVRQCRQAPPRDPACCTQDRATSTSLRSSVFCGHLRNASAKVTHGHQACFMTTTALSSSTILSVISNQTARGSARIGSRFCVIGSRLANTRSIRSLTSFVVASRSTGLRGGRVIIAMVPNPTRAGRTVA